MDLRHCDWLAVFCIFRVSFERKFFAIVAIHLMFDTNFSFCLRISLGWNCNCSSFRTTFCHRRIFLENISNWILTFVRSFVVIIRRRLDICSRFFFIFRGKNKYLRFCWQFSARLQLYGNLQQRVVFFWEFGGYFSGHWNFSFFCYLQAASGSVSNYRPLLQAEVWLSIWLARLFSVRPKKFTGKGYCLGMNRVCNTACIG